jgi:hypothetical protein
MMIDFGRMFFPIEMERGGYHSRMQRYYEDSLRRVFYASVRRFQLYFESVVALILVNNTAQFSGVFDKPAKLCTWDLINQHMRKVRYEGHPVERKIRPDEREIFRTKVLEEVCTPNFLGNADVRVVLDEEMVQEALGSAHWKKFQPHPGIVSRSFLTGYQVCKLNCDFALIW